MQLLSEFAITPDVLEASSYSTEEIAGIRLQTLKDVLLDEGIVRNLRDGAWLRLFEGSVQICHRRGKELLKKLSSQRRFRVVPVALEKVPVCNSEWCNEALASHALLPFSGIVTSQAVKINFCGNPLVSSIDNLSGTSWWNERSKTVRLMRTGDEYIKNLRLVFGCANSLMFVDPHLDPRVARYSSVLNFFNEMCGRNPAPLIEVHRVCYFNPRNKIDQYDEAGWKNMFDSWRKPLRSVGLNVEVFIWDDFHDRYLISDILGVGMPNGFDTSTDPQKWTTWSRLDRRVRDEVQREFDKAASPHDLKHHFQIL